MKKLIILLLFTIFTINTVPHNEVEAAAPEGIVWTCDNTYGEKAMQGELYFGEDATQVLINMPENPSEIWDNGSHILFVRFYDKNDLSVGGFEIPEFFGSQTKEAYPYLIDFSVLNVDSTAVKLKYTVPLAVGETCSSEWDDYYNNNSSSEIGYTDTPFGLMEWKYKEFSHSETLFNDVIAGSEWLTLTKSTPAIHEFQKDRVTDIVYYAEIDFYDSSYILLDTYKLCNFVTSSSYPSFTSPLAQGTYDTLYTGNGCNAANGSLSQNLDIDLSSLPDYSDIAYFKLREPKYLQEFAPSEIYYDTLSWSYRFDFTELPQVNFIIDGAIDYTTLAPIGSHAVYKTVTGWSRIPVKEGYNFVEWILKDGSTYDSGDVLDEFYLQGGEINIYAIFQEKPEKLVPVYFDSTPDEDDMFIIAITELGFNDPIERTIVFGFIAVATVFILLWKQVNMFASLIVVAVELIFFIYLGLLPMFAGVVIGLLLAVSLMAVLGGGSSEN